MTRQTFSSRLADATTPCFQSFRNETNALYTSDARGIDRSPRREIAEPMLVHRMPRTAEPEKDHPPVARRHDPLHRRIPLGRASEQDAVEATHERGSTQWRAAQAETAPAVRKIKIRTA